MVVKVDGGLVTRGRPRHEMELGSSGGSGAGGKSRSFRAELDRTSGGGSLLGKAAKSKIKNPDLRIKRI